MPQSIRVNLVCRGALEVNFGKMQLCRVERFYNSLFGVIVFSNHSQKWGQICWKSVQLDRVAFFRSDFFQNCYFSFWKTLLFGMILNVVRRWDRTGTGTVGQWRWFTWKPPLLSWYIALLYSKVQWRSDVIHEFYIHTTQFPSAISWRKKLLHLYS